MGITGYKPTKDTLAWCKRKIQTGKWKEGKDIPTLTEIAKENKVSPPTVKKVIKGLEEEGLIVSNLTNGYTVVPITLQNLKKLNEQKYYIAVAKLNLKLANEADKNAVFFTDYAIRKLNENKYRITNIINGRVITKTLLEIQKIVNEPITLKDLLNLNGSELTKAKKKYKEQMNLKAVAEFILRGMK